MAISIMDIGRCIELDTIQQAKTAMENHQEINYTYITIKLQNILTNDYLSYNNYLVMDK